MTTTRIPRSVLAVSALGAGASLALSACSTDGDSDGSGETGTNAATGTVNVFAAASLNNVGEELADAFNAANAGDTEIVFNFAGSSKLVQQIGQGADADLFISADEQNMDAALELAEFDGADAQVIATNLLVLATAPGNPAGIESLDDLASGGSAEDARIAICADGVPCGTLAHQVLDEKNITLASPTEEANVSDVATKIATGEVDAGFIYATDAQALQDAASGADGSDGEAITVIDIAATVDIEPNLYPAALTVEGQDNDTAAAFLEFLATDEAAEILEKYGFGAQDADEEHGAQ
ncbi:MAG TPA: molybdate ABC transporter substrate-binding protein [Candidatus Corynebacterium faecigallinarum]|uniref:Molybdate ABC transporter substrate-binding protein n=1 Tax=Candidatus Corynebacterium faecigallinarum TaxID=2838528 RepID=A0A9D2QEH1_9CORY|nr:molybdate ABC transporter substrate-binding protein [Candidatus Corynebacterium faecigallinarum]